MSVTACTPTFLTVDEVAEKIRRHPVTVREMLASGELHGRQRVKGGRWTIHVRCANAWLDGDPCEHQLTVTPIRPVLERAS